jgi:hypothetical protein
VLTAFGVLVATMVTGLAFALESSPQNAPATFNTPATTTTSSPSATPQPVTPTVVRPIEPQDPPPGKGDGNGNGNGKRPKHRDD